MEQGQKPHTAREHPEPERDTAPRRVVNETGEALKEDLDSLIDEIDEVLEENAEEFVKNYVQKGGE